MIPTPTVSKGPRKPVDRGWPFRYAQRLLGSDAVIVALACIGYAVVMTMIGAQVTLWENGPQLGYVPFMIGVAVVWLIFLDIFDTRDEHNVGHGVTEYRRILSASLATFVTITVVGFFLRTELSRPLFFIVLPAGALMLLFSRWLWRQWLRRQQRQHRYVHRAVILGELSKATHVADAINRAHGSGYDLLGILTDSASAARAVGAVPVLGDFTALVPTIDRLKVDTLILAGSDELDPQSMQALGWQLADRDMDLVVAPAMTDVAGPRVHARPVAGLPLVLVDYPALEGARRVLKRTFDIVGSSLLILLTSPLLLGIAIAVKLSSRGPVFYTQERVGRRGNLFGMLKFRSMVQGADDQLASLLDAQGTSDKPLFKVTNDPRITPVGRFLRKHSFDEFPQLFNVFLGQMSLVGPRPQRPAEVALYDDAAYRRLLVKPGMSGLWQVNGRSALSWEDALRFDLYYIENWSFTQDLVILFRTVKAVVKPDETAH